MYLDQQGTPEESFLDIIQVSLESSIETKKEEVVRSIVVLVAILDICSDTGKYEIQ